MENIVRLFAPDELVQTERLDALIRSADRITVEDSSEQIEQHAGVKSRRDIQSFRHYDEKLFKALHDDTRSAYDLMAGLPSLRIFPPKTRVSVRAEQPRTQKLFVDATGMLPLAGQELTGIPRVQDFIVRSALADTDPAVKIVLFDSHLRAYRHPTPREMRHLGSIGETAPPDDRSSASFVVNVHRSIRENPYLNRQFDRVVAAKAAGVGFGARFHAIKMAVRLYRKASQLTWHALFRSRENGPAIDADAGIVLMSHMAIFKSIFPTTLTATKTSAFICHDVIPWLYPQYATDKRQAERFVSHLRILLQNGAQAICTSETSSKMLRSFMADAGITNAPEPARFPLPSSLYEKAEAAGRILRFTPEQPFVLYCSTVEIRKNHLLLAQIWKKARGDGISLPKLVCAGNWGWGVEDLQAFLKANPSLANDIRFLGPVSDDELIDLYRSALFGVVPSRAEGWGFGVSECLDFGLPVIVSTATMEAARGLMPAFDPDDIEGWYTQIRRLAEGGNELRTLRDKIATSYKPVRESESWTVIKAAFRSEHANERHKYPLNGRMTASG
jgi:glycosyltransferase involved in cell wall biosynthesis